MDVSHPERSLEPRTRGGRLKYDHWLMVLCALALGAAVFHVTAEPRTMGNRVYASVHVAVSVIMFLLIFRRMGLGYAQ